MRLSLNNNIWKKALNGLKYIINKYGIFLTLGLNNIFLRAINLI